MNLPPIFIERTKAILKEEYPAFENALQQLAPTSIRINDKMDYMPSAEKVAWCDKGYYLNERPLFTADPLFHAGVYYVQEASSMFLSQVVEQHFPDADTVLDLCAAPGGKSTLLSQYLHRNCLLVSNEIVRNRAYILAENLAKWGNQNTLVTNNDPADFSALNNFFDAVVVDAPCSGGGMFRKDAGAIDEWSLSNVELCAERQKKILTDVWDALKPEGILVYSTCTYNREENEDNVAWMCRELDAELLKVDLHGNENIVESDFGYRFFPHRTKGEGFFIAVVRKNGSSVRSKQIKAELKKGIKFVKQNEMQFQLTSPEHYTYINDNNFIRAYQTDRFNEFMFLNNRLRCIESGLLMAEQKGKDFIPAAQLALSKALNTENLACADLDYGDAISFLKKESILLPDSKTGYVLVLFQNEALGWVKNLGNRSNNLYPNNWRIRMNL